MASLVFYRAEERLVEYRLRPGSNTIGRADSCDVALPGDEISRTHCLIQGKEGEWTLVDRSRHGTWIGGTRIQRHALAARDVFVVGQFRVAFRESEGDPAPTAEQEPDRTHELIIDTDAGIRVQRAVLVVASGPGEALRTTLRSSRVSVGGPGSHIELPDETLVRDHCYLRVSRGRVMAEPGHGGTYLDGARVRDITPLYVDDELRIGRTSLRVEVGTDDELPEAAHFGEMRGESRAMRRLFGTLRRISGHHFPVLITGESGTGKELVAHGIHDHSPRAGKPFVALNCGAISENLFESELFGHEKGAFTGADRRKDGAFHEASGGTLFLDEIGELPEAAQAKLLRALETGEVRRVGSMEVSYPDVRIVAATNRDLVMEVRRGTFREDLFFRLAVLGVAVPPLRDRIDDLEVLCRVMCRRLHPEAKVTATALQVLEQHDWPGNVRELRNVLTRAFVHGGARIDVGELTFHQLGSGLTGAVPAEGVDRNRLEEAERGYIMAILQKHGDNRSAAARELGVARSTLHYKLRKLGLG